MMPLHQICQFHPFCQYLNTLCQGIPSNFTVLHERLTKFSISLVTRQTSIDGLLTSAQEVLMSANIRVIEKYCYNDDSVPNMSILSFVSTVSHITSRCNVNVSS